MFGYLHIVTRWQAANRPLYVICLQPLRSVLGSINQLKLPIKPRVRGRPKGSNMSPCGLMRSQGRKRCSPIKHTRAKKAKLNDTEYGRRSAQKRHDKHDEVVFEDSANRGRVIIGLFLLNSDNRNLL